MSEWWSYRPADFLMFAPRTYWRLFELHNQAWWPAQPVLMMAGLAWLVWWMRGGARAPRVGLWVAACTLGFVGSAFLLGRYAPINWAASGFAIGFFVAAAGLAVLATRVDLRPAPRARRRAGGLLSSTALLAYPLLPSVFGRPMTQAEVFGLAPDPTALAILGLLVALQAATLPGRVLLAALQALLLVWCAISAATLGTMGSGQAGWVAAGAAIAGLALLLPRRAPTSEVASARANRTARH